MLVFHTHHVHHTGAAYILYIHTYVHATWRYKVSARWEPNLVVCHVQGSSDEENSDFIDFEDGEERDEDGTCIYTYIHT